MTFAAALAAIGAVAAAAPELLSGPEEELTAWWQEHVHSPRDDEPLPWSSPLGRPGWDGLSVDIWAALWNDRSFDSLFRFAVDRDLGVLDEQWVTGMLRSPGAIADGLFFPTDDTDEPASAWRFPLRVGLAATAGGAEIGRALDEAADAVRWVGTLIAPTRLGPTAVSADLILAVGSPDEIRGAFETFRELRADAVIAFSHDATLNTVEQLRTIFEVPVVAVVDHPDPAQWLIDFTEQFSHDAPFDVAFTRASPEAAVVEGPTAFMSGQRASRRATAVATTLRSLGSGTARSAGGSEGFALAADFEDAAVGAFTSEIGDASTIAEMERRAAPLIAEASASRWLQAQITDAAEPDRPLDSFRAGTDHEVRVRIGPSDAEWLQSAGEFPEDELSVGVPNRLTVVLTEPELLDRPLVDEIVLPATGTSTSCVFSLATRSDTTSIDARLIVLSGNRVLQTATLPKEVSVPEAVGRRGLHPTGEAVAQAETIIRGAGGNLADRRTFDAAIVVNHDREGNPGATVVTGGEAATVDLGAVSVVEALKTISDHLGDIVLEPGDFDGLDAEGTRELLLFLAEHGVLLRNALVIDFLGDTLSAATHLQVVSARPDAFFPFELAYDFTAPGENAVVCPEARAALLSGEVTAGCPGTHDQDIVCPFGFWGISKVIERHAFQRGQDAVEGDFLIRSQPSRDRGVIALTSQALVGASDRVDNFDAGSVQLLIDGVRAASGNVVHPPTWEQWKTSVSASESSLLMLLPHTVQTDRDSFALEIGSGDQATAAQIDKGFLPPDHPVIVVLLGCETAAAGKVGYERFPGIFRRAGAEVVVGTLTEVLGRHAAPVGAQLAKSLYECCENGPRSIGEAMLATRRRLLAEGLTMVLALAVFGDADWVLERAG
jgi:hypothetical protein